VTGRVSARDGTRYVIEVGGAGPAVLLLHGFTGSGAEWEPFLPALQRATTTVTADLLGHGGSDGPSDPARHALERQAADLAAILLRLELAPVHVVGYSFGARVALRLALDAPEAVRSLVLVSPSAGIADEAERAARRAADERLARLLETDGIDAFVRHWEALPLFAPERHLPSEVRARLHAARLANDPAALAASLRGAGQGVMAPLHGVLGQLGVPVTLLAGALDPLGTDRARAVAAAIARARLEIVAGAGHAPQREVPGVVARAIAGHLVRASEACSADRCAVVPGVGSPAPDIERPAQPAATGARP
jgi:2-succinyl-6-hydroxy-2,4-cyclohexadiene-1-carboxylate synthase